jgi:hypothetical protein
VAVESDGAAYAAMRSTRDRDRLRAEQLTRLGWVHLRVWSTDLFRDPARDVARVHAAVARAASGGNGIELVDETAQPAPEDFAPTTDEGGRRHRLRGRRAVRPAGQSKAEQTMDDTDAGWGERRDDDAHDRWLREQRPPHWGRD